MNHPNFEEKLTQLINRSAKVYDVTKEMIEKDYKVQVGLKEAPKDVIHYVIVVEKDTDESYRLTSMERLMGVSVLNSEQILFNFTDLKKRPEKSIIGTGEQGTTSLGNVARVNLFESANLAVQYKGLDILETANCDVINEFYKTLVLKEKDLNQVEAAKHREYLMSL
jgi:hypothetical protein